MKGEATVSERIDPPATRVAHSLSWNKMSTRESDANRLAQKRAFLSEPKPVGFGGSTFSFVDSFAKPCTLCVSWIRAAEKDPPEDFHAHLNDPSSWVPVLSGRVVKELSATPHPGCVELVLLREEEHMEFPF